MTAPSNKGQGYGIQFLRSLLGHTGDQCVIWPLFRDPSRGYGIIGFNGGLHKAHRLMCELAHGAPPSPDYEAAHSCGRGHDGCVNPRHLSWKTRSGNQADRKLHGTSSRKGQKIYKLNAEQVAEIRSQKDKAPVSSLAAKFGVTRSTIRQIYLGKIWQRPRRQLTIEEVAEIRSLRGKVPRRVVAERFGLTESKVYRVQTGGPYSAVPSAR